MAHKREAPKPKVLLVREARALCQAQHPEAPPHASCLYLAGAVIQVAAAHDIHLVLQAGSASWSLYPQPELIPEPTPTHFGYEWEGLNHPAVQVQLVQNRMPEMHVWAGDPVRQEIVDLTTWAWPQQAQRLAGLEWKTAAPPDFLWGKPPAVAYYQPMEDATLLAMRMLQRAGPLESRRFRD